MSDSSRPHGLQSTRLLLQVRPPSECSHEGPEAGKAPRPFQAWTEDRPAPHPPCWRRADLLLSALGRGAQRRPYPLGSPTSHPQGPGEQLVACDTRLDEAQAGIKTAGRNINKLSYTDDITLMAESEEELKSLLMKVKEESEKVGLKLSIQKMKIMASGPITSWQIDGEILEIVRDFLF